VIKIAKSSVEKIRMGLSQCKGKLFADLRVSLQADYGKWHPTKKGLTLGTELWPEFVYAIQKQGKQLREQGLLDSDN